MVDPEWTEPWMIEKAKKILESYPHGQVIKFHTADLFYQIDHEHKVRILLNPELLTQSREPLEEAVYWERAFRRHGYQVKEKGAAVR